jgi:hypothetical protein
MSSSPTGWQFTVLDDTYDDEEYCRGAWCYEPGGAVFTGLAIDAAGDLYSASGSNEVTGSKSYIFKLLQPYNDQTLVGFDGWDFEDVEVGTGGNLYGTTGACGGSAGTVWQLSP